MEILGVKVDNLAEEKIFEKVNEFLESDKQYYIVTLNPEFLVRARKDEEFRKILNGADLAVPDGVGLVFASWLLGEPLKKRLTGVDLMERICQDAARKQWRIILTGGGNGVAKKTAGVLKEKYKNLIIREINMEKINERLTERPSILLVALGMPKQEKWIVENLDKLPSVKLAIGVGGAFDFISGRVRRAPKIVQTAGLEWVWRLGVQPWRTKRVFNAVVMFPWMVVKSVIRNS